jgi:hypothetical protein
MQRLGHSSPRGSLSTNTLLWRMKRRSLLIRCSAHDAEGATKSRNLSPGSSSTWSLTASVGKLRGAVMARPERCPSPSSPWSLDFQVETMGLEPTTSCLQSRRSAGLSYVPRPRDGLETRLKTGTTYPLDTE